MLDNYIKDVVSSFFIFWLAIGPVVYESYFKKQDDQQQKQVAPKLNEIGKIEDDKYTQMLKQIKMRQAEANDSQ